MKQLGYIFNRFYSNEGTVVSRIIIFKLLLIGFLTCVIDALFNGLGFLFAVLISNVISAFVSLFFADYFRKSKEDIFLATLMPLGLISWIFGK